MAFAEYFDKNLQAAAVLLKSLNSEAFKAVLENEIIGISFDEAAVSTREGRSTLDMAVRLIARLYPEIAITGLDSLAAAQVGAYTTLAAAINPNINANSAKVVTRRLVVGKTQIPAPESEARTWYIGSNNWITKVSACTPVGCGRSGNPFGAGVAACLGAANIFRSVFSAQLNGAATDDDLTVSVLDLNSRATKLVNPRFKSVELNQVHLVGAGAVGNGFLWAIAQLRCTGELVIVDDENVASGNLQRYVNTVSTDVGRPKSELAAAWCAPSGLVVHAHKGNWADYGTARNDWKFSRVAVAVDSAKARIQVQASLPKAIFNSWTQSGEAGISRHTFLGDMACLACLYIPTTKALNFDQIVLRALKLPDNPEMLMNVRVRLDQGSPTDRAFLETVAESSGVPIAALLMYEARPLRELYVEAICGGTILDFGARGTGGTDVPMVFQSALAGILLAVEIVADAGQFRKAPPTMTQIDLLRAFPRFPSHARRKHPGRNCLCMDEDFQLAYRAKYGT
jgi:hypothetical protein